MTTETNNKPLATFRVRNIKSNVWKQETEKGRFYTVTISRTYVVEEKGEKVYKETSSFDLSEAPIAERLLKKGFEAAFELEQADQEAA